MKKNSHEAGSRNSADAPNDVPQAKKNTNVPMAKAIEQNSNRVDAIRVVAPLLLDQMAHCEWLQRELDKAFAGQPFDLNQSPTSPANRRRFRAYFRTQKAIEKLMIRLIHEWIRLNGVDPANPQQMWENPVITGGTGAAGAPSGSPAPGKSQPVAPDQSMTVTPETVAIAQRLSEMVQAHRARFKINATPGTNEGKDKTHDETKVSH